MEHIKTYFTNVDRWIRNILYDAWNVIVKPERINLNFQDECQNRTLDKLNISWDFD